MKINPLNVLGQREVEGPPPLFHYVLLDLRTSDILEIRNWIFQNLKHRFYIGETLVLDNDNQFQKKIKIGFEDPKESSFFLLSCSFLTS